MTEMGEVYSYLLRHRLIESHPRERRRRTSRAGLISERDACALLRSADEEQLDHLRAFLAGQGLRLALYDSADYPGIPPGGYVYMLLRQPQAELPPMFSQQRVLEKLCLRDNSKETGAVWFVHLWLLMLGLIYTRNSRSLSDVSFYQDAIFSLNELIESVKNHLESLRRTGQENDNARHINILICEKGEDIPRRARRFVEILLEAGFITREEKDGRESHVYQQTLLGALEMEQSGLNHLRHLIPQEIVDRTVGPHDDDTQLSSDSPYSTQAEGLSRHDTDLTDHNRESASPVTESVDVSH